MLYLEHRPRPPLAAFVEKMWLVSADAPPFRRELILPDGAIELFFNLGQPHTLIHGASRRDFARTWVSGQRTRQIVVEFGGDCRLAGVRFRPGGAARFLGVAATEVTDRVLPLDLLWGRAAESLREQVAEAAHRPARLFRRLEAVLEARAGDALLAPSPVDAAILLLDGADDGLSPRATAARLGLSQRQLLRWFDREVGVGPKMLQRVLRLQRALHAAWPSPRPNWAFVAAAAGYFDQAHLYRDFRALTGLTPGQYAAARDGWMNEIPIC